MRTQPKVGMFILCLSHLQSLGLFFTKYIFTSDLPFFLKLGKATLMFKKSPKALASHELFTFIV